MIFWGLKNIAGECSLKIPYGTIAVKRDEDLIQHEHDKEMDKQLDTAGDNNSLFRGEEALHLSLIHI